jgi:hypothetical protein
MKVTVLYAGCLLQETLLVHEELVATGGLEMLTFALQTSVLLVHRINSGQKSPRYPIHPLLHFCMSHHTSCDVFLFCFHIAFWTALQVLRCTEVNERQDC